MRNTDLTRPRPKTWRISKQRRHLRNMRRTISIGNISNPSISRETWGAWIKVPRDFPKCVLQCWVRHSANVLAKSRKLSSQFTFEFCRYVLQFLQRGDAKSRRQTMQNRTWQWIFCISDCWMLFATWHCRPSSKLLVTTAVHAILGWRGESYSCNHITSPHLVAL